MQLVVFTQGVQNQGSLKHTIIQTDYYIAMRCQNHILATLGLSVMILFRESDVEIFILPPVIFALALFKVVAVTVPVKEPVAALNSPLNVPVAALSTPENVPLYEDKPDGSRIIYLHDKPALEDSKTVYKQTIDGFFISTDGVPPRPPALLRRHNCSHSAAGLPPGRLSAYRPRSYRIQN